MVSQYRNFLFAPHSKTWHRNPLHNFQRISIVSYQDDIKNTMEAFAALDSDVAGTQAALPTLVPSPPSAPRLKYKISRGIFEFKYHWTSSRPRILNHARIRATPQASNRLISLCIYGCRKDEDIAWRFFVHDDRRLFVRLFRGFGRLHHFYPTALSIVSFCPLSWLLY